MTGECNEPQGSVKSWKFIHQLSNCYQQKKDSLVYLRGVWRLMVCGTCFVIEEASSQACD
jgi:hypothetical protein